MGFFARIGIWTLVILFVLAVVWFAVWFADYVNSNPYFAASLLGLN